jgi:hypothetical protein
MILSQNIYGYGSWVVISIVLFDISKNDPFLVPYIVHLENHNGVQLISVSIDSVSTLALMFRVDLLLSYYSVLCEAVY